MELIHVTRDFPPEAKGGISTALISIVEALEKKKLKNKIISFDDYRPTKNIHLPLSFDGEIMRIRSKNSLEEAFNMAKDLEADWLMVHNDLAWDFAKKCAEEIGAKIALYCHVLQKQMNLLKDISEETLSLNFQERAFKEADLIWSPSKACKEKILQFYPHLKAKIKVFPFGFFLEKNEHQIFNRQDFIFYSGRFDWVKGTREFFAAIPKILRAESHIKIKISGGLPGNRKAEKRWIKWLKKEMSEQGFTNYEDQVEFLGWLQTEDLKSYYQKAKILVAPSRFETLGQSVLEAMRFGAAVVTTKEGGLADFVTLENSQIVEKKEANQIAEAVLRLWKDPILRKRQTEAARKEIESNWNYSKKLQYLDLID